MVYHIDIRHDASISFFQLFILSTFHSFNFSFFEAKSWYFLSLAIFLWAESQSLYNEAITAVIVIGMQLTQIRTTLLAEKIISLVESDGPNSQSCSCPSSLYKLSESVCDQRVAHTVIRHLATTDLSPPVHHWTRLSSHCHSHQPQAD